MQKNTRKVAPDGGNKYFLFMFFLKADIHLFFAFTYL